MSFGFFLVFKQSEIILFKYLYSQKNIAIVNPLYILGTRAANSNGIMYGVLKDTFLKLLNVIEEVREKL